MVSPARVFVEPSKYNLWLNVDVHERSPDAKPDDYSVQYFKGHHYLGQIGPGGIFTYEFKHEELAMYCEAIIAVTLADLQDKRRQMAALLDQISALEDSVPLALKPTIGD